MTVVYPPREPTPAQPPRGRGRGGGGEPGRGAPRRASVTVGGVGRSVVVPDALQVELAVEAKERAVAAAMRVARSAMAEVRRVVSDAGVAEADQRTSGLSIHPGYDDRSGTQSGYVATESLSVMLRDPELIDAVLSGAADVAGDLLRVNGLGFTVTDPTAAEDDARRLALAEARRRAQLYAAELDAAVGPLLRLAEGHGGGRDAGDFRQVAMARDTSVEPGSQVVTVQVSAEWALVPEAVSPADPR